MPEKAVPEEKTPVAVPEKSEPPSARGTYYHEYMVDTSNLLKYDFNLFCHFEP